jgi:glyoxylase-like metal-dependent hydrolase (beta-lactamase superfamily II)
MRKHKRNRQDGVSRRDFFKAAGAGLGAGWVPELIGSTRAAATGEAPVRFAPSAGLTQLSPGLYFLPDTGNVYILKDGDRALLIDFGPGHVLKLLSEIGVTGIDGILHTHHHRDQCQGDQLAVSAGIPIHVPEQERYLFEDAENFWRNRRVFHLIMCETTFSL